VLLIGYEIASEDFPFIPGFVILMGEGGFVEGLRLTMRTTSEPLSREALEELVSGGKVKLLDSPETEPWRDDSWPVAESGGLKWFFLSDEKRWREARAKSLLREAEKVVGDPVRKLSLLAASGSMGKVDVPELVSSLEKQRKSPSESLLDIYKRLETNS
jgi:hypothetical protein